ncbi:heme A synthase [bacterium]|nr:heme A synthase [bacterium]
MEATLKHTQSLKRFHILAWITALSTLALITLGGFVHNTGSSLACPDWPLCFGQVMPKMEGGVAIEHSHRLLASFVGLLSIGLVYLAHPIRAQHPKLYKVSIYALLAVIVQGILGGITVIYKLPPMVSTSHLGLSQIYFAITLWMVLRSRGNSLSGPAPSSKILKFLATVTGLLFLQMLIGAAMRHTGAGAACGLGPEYSVLCLDAATGGTTWWPEQAQSQFHVIHRYLGILMVFFIVGATIPLIKWAKANGHKVIRILCVAAHVVVLLQVILGIMSVMSHLGPSAVTLHLTFAAALFALLISLNILSREAKNS